MSEELLYIIRYKSVKKRTEIISHNMLIIKLTISWEPICPKRKRTSRDQQIAKQDLKDHSRAISSHGVPLHPAAKRWRV